MESTACSADRAESGGRAGSGENIAMSAKITCLNIVCGIIRLDNRKDTRRSDEHRHWIRLHSNHRRAKLLRTKSTVKTKRCEKTGEYQSETAYNETIRVK